MSKCEHRMKTIDGGTAWCSRCGMVETREPVGFGLAAADEVTRRYPGEKSRTVKKTVKPPRPASRSK